MAEDNSNELFSRIRGFGWDNNKRDKTLREREIDFDLARFVFDGPIFVRRSDRGARFATWFSDFLTT